jgi:ABC-2 type transport system ATP-binding protein
VTGNQPRLERGSRRASSPAAGGAAELASVIRDLDDAAIGVDEFGLRRPTLDEVFLALTGSGPAAAATPHVANGSPR